MIDTELLIVISVDIVLLLIAGCVIIFGILDPIERPDITEIYYAIGWYAYCTLKGLRDLPYTFGVHNISKKCKRWRRGKSHFITMSPHEVNCLARILCEYYSTHHKRYDYIVHTIISYYGVTKDRKIGFILDKFGVIRYTNLGD